MINLWIAQNRLLASYRKAGQLSIRELGDALYTAYTKDPNALADERSIVDRRPHFPGWTELVFLDYDSRRSALEANPGVLYEADVSPARRFLTDHNCVIEAPRRAYLDLETDSRVPFSEAIQGRTTLLSWALVDEEGGQWTSVLEDDNRQAEAELWAALWTRMGDYDQIVAWTGDRFDFAVTTERSMMLAKSYSRIMEPFWEHRRRLLFVDHMLAFKRHHMAAESGDEKTSLKLGDVCESLFGEGKHDFDAGQTWEAWSAGGSERQRLVDYNLQDTALLPKLEAATGYLQLQQTIAEITLTPVNTRTLSPMPWIDAYLLKLAHKRKTHLPSKVRGESTEAVEGAVVMAPTKLGVHENVHVCDFKSLYPTVIRTWNLGNETKLGKELVEGACRAATGVYFRTDVKSMLSQFCEDMMNLRDHHKKEMKKHPPGTPAWKDAERKSKAYKIANNSGFGVTGNPYFRLFDPEITEAIIQGARLLLTTTSDEAVAQGKDSIYGDTDSLFVVGGDVSDFEAFVAYCNTEVYPRLLAKYMCRPDFCCIELAYEKQFSRLVFPLSQDLKGPSAKRYAGMYRHYGGKEATADSKPEIRGLEWMRTDTTRAARHMQREAIEMVLRGHATSEQMEEWVKARRTAFFDQPVKLEDIVLSKGISMDLSLYKVNTPHVRLAKIMAEAGEDVGEGTRISYVIIDGRMSPTAVIPAADFNGNNLDRVYYWAKSIFPPTMRFLAGAFPDRPWNRWTAKYPKMKVAPTQLSLV